MLIDVNIVVIFTYSLEFKILPCYLYNYYNQRKTHYYYYCYYKYDYNRYYHDYRD